MKEFIEIMAKDIMSENFTKREYIVYGILAPLGMIAIIGLVGWIDAIL